MSIRLATAAALGGLSVLLPALAAGPALAETAVREIPVAGFTQVHLEGAMDITIRQGARFSVVASGSPAALDRVQAKVDGGVLALDQESTFFGNHGKVTVAITMPALQAVKVKGSGDVTLSAMKLGRVSLAVSGAGDIIASGTCDELEASVSGAGDIVAKNLKCRAVSARVSGAGDIAVHARQSVHASVRGVGDIDIYGDPKERESQSRGVGDITYHAGAR